MDILILTFIVLVFLMINGYLGSVAWRRTKNADDYQVAGRDPPIYIMGFKLWGIYWVNPQL